MIPISSTGCVRRQTPPEILRRIGLVLAVLLLTVNTAQADFAADVRRLFDQDPAVVDFEQVKLAVDQMIDPAIDGPALSAEIDQMVAALSRMVPDGADSWSKIAAIRQLIYQPGPWNGYRAFAYDLDDPSGKNPRNNLLSDYLGDRRGNCVSMPILFLILAQRLDLDVTLALAPLHTFVKVTDDQGRSHNLEATSGAGRTRDLHYRRHFPISDAAIANGVYLAQLDARQSVAVIAAILVDHLIAQGRYHQAMAIADILLRQHPEFVYVMLKKGSAAAHLIRTRFREVYATIDAVPERERPYLIELKRINQTMFNRAEQLGWTPNDPSTAPPAN